MIRVERSNQFIKKLMGFAVLALLPILLNSQIKEINDQNINDQIDQEMFFQLDVPAHKINPTSSDGIVTLTGTVNNLLAKERTLEVVKSVKGVKGIIDQIDVSPEARNDLQIVKDIQEALRDDPATEEYEVAIEVQNGNVTLSGKVDSRQE